MKVKPKKTPLAQLGRVARGVIGSYNMSDNIKLYGCRYSKHEHPYGVIKWQSKKQTIGKNT